MERLFPTLKDTKWVQVNLDEEYKKRSLDMFNVDDQIRLLDELKKEHKANTYGGFREDRSAIWKGFESSTMIHLGVDFNNLEMDTPVASLAEGDIVQILQDPDKFNGWGTKVIVQSGSLFFLYGHLYKCPFQKGDTVKQGEIIGLIAPPSKNGGWFPHLHLQIMDSKKLNKFILTVDGYEFEKGEVSGLVDPLAWLQNSKTE